MKIYLLNIGELIRESHESRFSELLPKLDETRREKVLAAKTPQVRAAELGAGLLLQKAVQDRLVQKADCGAVRGFAQEISQGSPPDGVLCTVSGLASQLEAPLALTYHYGKKGKPFFKEIPLFFSLSHSGDYVLCAVSCRELGADIQRLQPVDVLKLSRRFYSEPECLALERCADEKEMQRLFFELWSRKEAWGKLTGKGVAAVLGQDLTSGKAAQDIEWAAASPPEGYALAVCVRRKHSV